MTDEELRVHWGETAPAPREPRRVSHGHVLAAIALGILLLIALMPGILREAQADRDRQIRVCELSKTMAGATPVVAELLCAREWER